jgi:hypothetical protein
LEDVHEQPNRRALAGTQRIDLTLRMGAPPVRVWHVLTAAPLLQRWLSDQPVSVTTDWQPGSPIVTTGAFHGTTYVQERPAASMLDISGLFRTIGAGWLSLDSVNCGSSLTSWFVPELIETE